MSKITKRVNMHNNNESFSFTGRIRSFSHAISGILEMLKGQHNAWVHLAATVILIIMATYLQVSKIKCCVLILAAIIVWVAEALNTAFEFLCDVASPDFHPLVKKSKDVAAGAVLISAIGAVIIGLVVLSPYLTK